MEQLIGRKKEIEILGNAVTSPKSELIAIYGRRRVGKTFLIREVFKSETIFEVTGLYSGNMDDQIEGFFLELSKRQHKKIPAPAQITWLQAFNHLEQHLDMLVPPEGSKLVLFFDEFPWMATAKSKFLMAFEHFWNHYCTKRDDLIIIISGSSASYMIKKIINNKGGLHNRLSRTIRLLPFDLYETDIFLKSRGIDFSYYDTAQIYMALGGIPHYLEKIKRGTSVARAIDELCFEQSAPLRDEFNNLFDSLFKDSKKYKTIIRILAKTNKGITRKQLIEKCKIQSSGDFTTRINDLIESGFVSSYRFFGNKHNQMQYRLSDEYSRFYIKFIETNENMGENTWLQLYFSSSYNAWIGFSFELLCLKHVKQIKKQLRIDTIYSINSSWFNDNTQIDLLIDRNDNIINLCEIKFSSSEYVIDQPYSLNLRRKIQELREASMTKKNIFITMITTFGIQPNKYSREIVQNSITLSDLFTN